ncbi:methyltransferase domain-containing protein [Lentzea tibetensis]|uniref:Methyltransferase domain-containing protein n=1 Tax=Lentzea tibetensis TaxID=2591470 RepID=A0A563EFE6_9PSEU|nr:class I SAM-dependent methyltransferase [Lentzea tibetensis]TWP44495.1 methyltransferase domain-containing protein [Lentzea tibetensis]
MTSPDFIAATRESYDALADGYAAWDLDGKPFDRAFLTAFAEFVGSGPVADVGCGTGWLTDVLHRMGLDAFGVDLSPGMVGVARRNHPHLRFEVGSMLAMDVADSSLGGLVAAFSIIHIPWELRPELFAEFHRVLAPGGQLMLVFQVGDERRHLTEGWGKTVDLTWYRQQPGDVADLLRDAGLAVRARFVRQPGPAEKCPNGYVFAAKPR